MTMKYVGVILAFIVAKCLLQVHGFPGVRESNQDGSSSSSSNSMLSNGVRYRNYIVCAANGTLTGFAPGTEYTVNTLDQALSSTSYQSLANILGVDTSNAWFKKGNFVLLLRDFILGQSQNPPKGIINFETAMVFAEAFVDVGAETAAALKTISYIMMKMKQQNNGTPVDISSCMRSALYTFYGSEHIDNENIQNWMSIAPFISRASEGDLAAAGRIVSYLASANADLTGLRNSDPYSQYYTLEAVIKNVFKYTDFLRHNYMT